MPPPLLLLLLLLLPSITTSNAATSSRSAGNIAYRSGDISSAIHFYRQWTQANPSDVQSLSNLATALYSTVSTSTTTPTTQQVLDEVLLLYRRAINLTPPSTTTTTNPTNNPNTPPHPPTHAAKLHFNYGSALLFNNQHELAKSQFKLALQHQPNFPEALQNLGAVQQQLGSYTDAESMFRQSLAMAQDDLAARWTPRNNLWSLLKAQGRHEDLKLSYQEEITINPTDPDVFNDYGALLHTSSTNDAKELQHALRLYKQAVLLDQNHRAHVNIGLATLHRMVEQDHQDEWDEDLHAAVFHFRRGHQGSEYFVGMQIQPSGDSLYYPRPWVKHNGTAQPMDPLRPMKPMTCALLRKLHHDNEQLEYILSLPVKVSHIHAQTTRLHLRQVQALYTRLVVFYTQQHLCATPGTTPPSVVTHAVLSKTDQQLLFSAWRKALHSAVLPFTMTFSSPLNPLVQKEYGGRPRQAQQGYRIYQRNQILVLDNVLTKQALRDIRSWLLQSTVWHSDPKEHYVGATIEQGILAHPTMVQLAVDLPQTFPNIFCQGKRRLTQVWAYSYHNFEHLPHQQGIGVHADESAINGNIWIDEWEDPAEPEEEDSAKPQVNGGHEHDNENGLVIYAKHAPLAWDMQEYNNPKKEQELKVFLEDSPWYNIKYKSNRLVLFNGNLFHSSMPLKREKHFGKRRINLTFLFGKRGASCKK